MGSSLSILASVAIIRSSFNEFIPQEIRNYIWEFSRKFSSEFTIVVKESHEGSTNHLFNALVTYLGTNAFSNTSSSSSSSTSPRRVTVGKNESMKILTYGLDRNSEIVDVYSGVPMRWGYYTETNSTLHYELRWYELRFHKRYSDLVKNKYLPYVLDMAKRIKDQNRMVKFYTTRGGRDGWSSKGLNLDHPMTFETLAMDGDLKSKVIEDLNGFIRGKEYYKKIGKVWKRGYLLYGPPGTGKSSLIAAMANYLNFDIYNLNLSAVNSDSSLEYLLLHMSNRSILVVEDIDCSVMIQNRQAAGNHQLMQDHSTQVSRPQVTLSGLLNAIDGLLSCCGDERIIVFTTNYKERIDPALLRAGRMDMHIYLSYCTFSTFKQLAESYLDIWDHDLFSSVEKLIKLVQVSPADVAGELMKNKDAKTSLEGLIKLLEDKKSEAKLIKSEVESNGGNTLKQNGDNEVFESHKQVESRKACPTSMKEKKYRVKEEFEGVLEAIFSKYGDIAANCSLYSIQCRSSFLEIVCDILKTLKSSELKNLTQVQLETMINSIKDLESVRMEVGWLRRRLEDIMKEIKTEYKQDMKETGMNLQDSSLEELLMQKISNGKLNLTLVDGLI